MIHLVAALVHDELLVLVLVHAHFGHVESLKMLFTVKIRRSIYIYVLCLRLNSAFFC